MSSNTAQFGLPLVKDVKQTILPVIENCGSTALVLGFFPISATTFDGTETTFTLSSGTVDIESYTVAETTDQGHGLDGVSQYMAMVLSYRQAKDNIITGYVDFVSAGNDGYYSSWAMPSRDWVHRYNAGTLLQSLRVGMASTTYTSPSAPDAPEGSDATLKWAASVDLTTNGSQCAFFDFNWINLFQTSMKTDGTNGALIPLSIATKTNPSGGYFKAAYIASKPVIIPGGAPLFNTIRIIRLKQDVPAGDYGFVFTISYTKDSIQVSTDVTLTLTVN